MKRIYKVRSTTMLSVLSIFLLFLVEAADSRPPANSLSNSPATASPSLRHELAIGIDYEYRVQMTQRLSIPFIYRGDKISIDSCKLSFAMRSRLIRYDSLSSSYPIDYTVISSETDSLSIGVAVAVYEIDLKTSGKGKQSLSNNDTLFSFECRVTADRNVSYLSWPIEFYIAEGYENAIFVDGVTLRPNRTIKTVFSPCFGFYHRKTELAVETGKGANMLLQSGLINIGDDRFINPGFAGELSQLGDFRKDVKILATFIATDSLQYVHPAIRSSLTHSDRISFLLDTDCDGQPATMRDLGYLIRRNTRWDIPPHELIHFEDTARLEFLNDSIIIDVPVSSALFVFGKDAKISLVDDSVNRIMSVRSDSIFVVLYCTPNAASYRDLKRKNPLPSIAPGPALLSSEAPATVRLIDTSGAELAVKMKSE